MDSSTDVIPEGEAEIEINPMVHLIAPVAAVIGTIVVRKVVNTLYERATGHPAPMAHDPRVPIFRAILWTAVITTSAAVAEVAVYRIVNRMGEKRA